MIELPQKMVCVGMNYRDHAEEQGIEPPPYPILFAKWPNTIIGDGDAIRLPANSIQIDYEAELGFVIGRVARDVRADDALEFVRGYVAANDVSRVATSSSPTASGFAESRSTRSCRSAS